MSDFTNAAKSELDLAEERRSERKAKAKAAHDVQRALDLQALDEVEIEHGDGNVCHVCIPHTPGLPTLVAARTPTAAEIKRYQSRVRGRGDQQAPDVAGATAEIGQSCMVYPADEQVRAEVLRTMPAVLVNLGMAALALASGRAADEGKG